jgi:hypothetical protein
MSKRKTTEQKWHEQSEATKEEAAKAQPFGNVPAAHTVRGVARTSPMGNSVIPVRQGCGLGRQLVDGICVSNAQVRAAVRKCSARKMRMVNGRCEPRARPAAAPAVTPPATQQPAATPATPR